MLAIKNAGMDAEQEVMLLQDVQAFMEAEFREMLGEWAFHLNEPHQ